ncbi:Multicopper oxidase with three cupredoxin domains (includes cell division protein FtsP and spore coat protein CotA) [Rhizobiales bacterium GAS191]|nr:Multicopper oxidase with three cupredoxin domains (includes cell division protein FtsP and spore coat protein CotA) [Rhizobiales bacterium GAS191]
MSKLFSRRRFLNAALAAGVLPILPSTARAARKRLVAGTRVLEVNGRSAKIFGLNGPDGRPGIRLAAGERFRVELANESGTRTLIHWHGQLPPWTQDGFPWPQTPPITNGAVQSYDYAPIPGTYWMHSHHDMQEQSLMTAPLIVHSAAELREDRQEVVLMLHDFTFRTPEEVLAGLTGTTVAAAQAMAQKTEEAPADKGDANVPEPRIAGMADRVPRMAMPGMTMSGPSGMQMHMDLNDVHYDAFLANDRTLADPQIVRVERGGHIRLRVINGASSSQFWIDLGDLVGRVVATDGHPVHPVAGNRFPLAMAQRLDILIDLPRAGAFPILARLEGDGRQTGIVLATPGGHIPRIDDSAQAAPPVDQSLEARLMAVEPLSPRSADIVQTIALGGGMKPYAWSMNGEYWPQVSPLMLTKGQRVEIDLVNRTMMAHPIHLHGHAFQVIAIDGRPIQGAVRDTVLVMPMGRVRIAFDADNPGRWPLHCHNLYHQVTGMMTEFRYQGIVI